VGHSKGFFFILFLQKACFAYLKNNNIILVKKSNLVWHGHAFGIAITVMVVV
jgi:hypothetical protein